MCTKLIFLLHIYFLFSFHDTVDLQKDGYYFAYKKCYSKLFKVFMDINKLNNKKIKCYSVLIIK